MPALILNLLKVLFLGLLYLFVWQVVLAVRGHLGTEPKRRTAARELVILRGARRRVRLPVGGGVIGRSDEADIPIDDPYASEFHVRVAVRDGTVVVHDLGSTNGTYVNGRRITAPTPVGKGDTVQIGKTILEVR